MTLDYNNKFQVHLKDKVLIIWSPKSACTTVNCMFFEHENLLKKALTKYKWIHQYRKEFQKKHSNYRNECIQYLSPLKYIHFCVNPYRRAVSSYLHGMCRPTVPIEHKNISFHEFLIRLKSGLIPSNPHHNLQSFYKDSYKYITVVKMENIDKEIKHINKKFRLHYKTYKPENIKKKSDKINYFIGNDKWETFKNDIPNDYTYFYNNEIKKLVYDLYKIDIKNLGYNWKMFIDYEKKNL